MTDVVGGWTRSTNTIVVGTCFVLVEVLATVSLFVVDTKRFCREKDLSGALTSKADKRHFSI
jgi:hypothetical protein